jgi:hypothetical protein
MCPVSLPATPSRSRSVISLLRSVFRSPDAATSSTDIVQALAEVDARISAKTEERVALSSRRIDVLIDDEAGAAKLRRRIADLTEEIADFSAAREQLVKRLEQARAAEAEQEARRRYAAAVERRDATLKVLRQRLPKHVREHLALIRLIEETRAEVEAANFDPPPGAAFIADAESLLRDRPGVPEEVINEVREVVWMRTDRYPAERIDVTKVRDFRDLGGGRGQFVELTAHVGGEVYRAKTDQPVDCIGFVEVKRTVRAAVQGHTALPLRKIAMPGLRSSDPGYELPNWNHNATPDEVLAAIERAEAPVIEAATAEREVRVVTTREDMP